MKKNIEKFAAAVDEHIHASLQWYENLWKWAGDESIARSLLAGTISFASVLLIGVTLFVTFVLTVGGLGEFLIYFFKGIKPHTVIELLLGATVALVYFTGQAAKNKE